MNRSLPRALGVILMILLVGTSTQPRAASEPIPEIHCKHFIHGYPTGTPPTNDLIIRDLYALSSNDTTKLADWVAYRLTPHEVLGTLDLERKWRSDPFLAPEETLEGERGRDDYRKASRERKYDRGHQAPLGSFKGSRYASQVNYMSNITPQKADLNQGPWKTLEAMIRNLVNKHQEVWVMTGPLYERTMPALPEADEPHKVPSGYWKIVVVQEGRSAEDIKVAGFIFDQATARQSPVGDHVKSVDEIEARTGLDFLRELPDDEEERVESAIAAAWVAQWR